MDRAALADLLRNRRERLRPADIGLPPGIRRRTPGLRRDEVAGLAAISTDYYARLEQQRGSHPSAEVLASLARALRFTDDERDHLFHLAGQSSPSRTLASAHLSPGLLHLLDRLTDCPAMVVDDLGVVLRQNAMSRAVTGDVSALRGRDRYSTWRWFCLPGSRDRIPREDWDEHSRIQVADLRATHGRRGADPDVANLVTDLKAGSAEFTGLWDEHDVAVRRRCQTRRSSRGRAAGPAVRDTGQRRRRPDGRAPLSATRNRHAREAGTTARHRRAGSLRGTLTCLVASSSIGRRGAALPPRHHRSLEQCARTPRRSELRSRDPSSRALQ